MHESLKIIKQSMESLIPHFEMYTQSFTILANEIYIEIEVPKGEFDASLVSDSTNRPYRCEIEASGFSHLHTLNHTCLKGV
jgi:NADH:ubiquinone oxidoreductase subunit D